jgi:predicted ATPase
MKLTGDQYELLQSAMLQAFPAQGQLKIMVRTQLNENLESIAGGTNLSEVVFDLIQWAEARGRIEALVIGACKDNPGSPELHTFADTFLTDCKAQIVPHNLPRQLTSFVGREKERAEIRALLSSRPLVTLLGSGGCGKTRLALQVAEEMLEHYREGVCFVKLASLTNPELVAEAVAAALKVREVPNQPLEESLIEFLKTRRILLVLDNCETLVLAIAALTAQLLACCPQLTILATSREQLSIPGETVYPVAPLSYPDATQEWDVNTLAHYEAVSLFVQRAAMVRPNFALDSGNAQWVAEICHRLDGIPLAIELAACRVDEMGVKEIARCLEKEQHFKILTHGPRTAEERHTTLRKMVDWSVHLLSEPEQTLLQRLSVFQGGWTLEAAEYVCKVERDDDQSVRDTLGKLVEKSLVTFNHQDSHPRYQMLETIRLYCREMLAEAGREEIKRAHDRHFTFFLRLAEKAEAALLGREQKEWLRRLTAEHSNLRAALEWCQAQRDTESGLRLAGAMVRFWFLGNHIQEGKYLTRLLKSAETVPLSIYIKALTGAGILAYIRGDSEEAYQMCARVLALPRSKKNAWHIGVSLVIVGVLTQYQGQLKEAATLFEQSFALAREEDDGWLTALAQSALGLLNLYQGDAEQANILCAEGLSRARQAGERWCTFNALYSLGIVTLTQADCSRARTLFTEALSLSQSLGHSVSMAFCLEGLAGVDTAEGHSERAILLCGAASAWRDVLGVSVPPAFRANYDHHIAALRKAIGKATFTEVWTQGHQMTFEQAIQYALQEPVVHYAVVSEKSSIPPVSPLRV